MGFPLTWQRARGQGISTLPVHAILGAKAPGPQFNAVRPKGMAHQALPCHPKRSRAISLIGDECARKKAATEALRLARQWDQGTGVAAGLGADPSGTVLDPEGFWVQKLMCFEARTIRLATAEYKRWLMWQTQQHSHAHSEAAVANQVQAYIHARSRKPFMRHRVYHHLRWCVQHLRPLYQ